MAIDLENFDWALKKAKKSVSYLAPVLVYGKSQNGKDRTSLHFTIPGRAHCTFVLTRPNLMLDIDTELSIFLRRLKERYPAQESANKSAEPTPCRAG